MGVPMGEEPCMGANKQVACVCAPLPVNMCAQGCLFKCAHMRTCGGLWMPRCKHTCMNKSECVGHACICTLMWIHVHWLNVHFPVDTCTPGTCGFVHGLELCVQACFSVLTCLLLPGPQGHLSPFSRIKLTVLRHPSPCPSSNSEAERLTTGPKVGSPGSRSQLCFLLPVPPLGTSVSHL